MRAILNILSHMVALALKMVRALLRYTLPLLVVLALFAFNVAALTVPAVFRAVSGLVEAVTPDVTVARRHEAELAGERRRVARAQSEVAEVGARLHAAEAELTRIRVAEREARDAVERLHQERRRLVSRVDGVSARVLRRAASSAARAPAALLASSMPLVGRGIDLTFTLYDLQDACAMVQDLADLRQTAELGLLDEVGRVCGVLDLLPSLNDLNSPPSQLACTDLLEDAGMPSEACAAPQGPVLTDQVSMPVPLPDDP